MAILFGTEGKLMRIIKLLFTFSLLVIFALFIAQNSGYVDINLLYQTHRVPLFVILLLSFGLGFIFPFLFLAIREAMLKRKMDLIDKGLGEFSRGYIEKGRQLLREPAKQIIGLNGLLVEILKKQKKWEEIDSYSSIVPAIVGEVMIREKGEKAEEQLKKALSQDNENLRALKGLRDLYALRNDWKKAFEYQERILNLCEKWEKEHQKRIKAEIMAKMFLEDGREEFIEKAMDISSTSFVYSVYIKHLLLQDRIKDAKKHWEKAISLNYHEYILWNLIEDETNLTKLFDIIQERKDQISPDTLAVVYIKLNLFSKAQDLENQLSDTTRALLYSASSHRVEDKYCLQSLWNLIKPFECSCGEDYNTYNPICHKCLAWVKISMRRFENVNRY